MSEQALSDYVLENYAKATKMDLGRWLELNPLPAICEQKWDGYRYFLFKSGEKLVLASKYGAVYNEKRNPEYFEKMADVKNVLADKLILDCELVRQRHLHAFDVLQVEDRDVRSLKLGERKKILTGILKGSRLEVAYSYVKSIEGISSAKEEAIAEGHEGVILKNPTSSYNQPNAWLKLKKYDTLDCFVTRYEETQEMRRTGNPRSWFVGVYNDHGKVVELGKVGAFIEKVNPFSIKINTVVEIQFQEVTTDLKLRAPFIIRIRHDKKPKECLLSQVPLEEFNRVE